MNYLYRGYTDHVRTHHAQHYFRYPVLYVSVPLSVLDRQDTQGLLLAFNRPAIFSIYARDYLVEGEQSLAHKLQDCLASREIPLPQNTYLVTAPRVFGYCFNPVSFYVSFDSEGRFHSVIAEVNNTFGEKHLYVMHDPQQRTLPATFHFAKDFYVSPFLMMSGEYTFTLESYDNLFSVMIIIKNAQGDRVFSASVKAERVACTQRALLIALIFSPLVLLGTMLRIHLQAFILSFKKRIPHVRKTQAVSTNTVRVSPTMVHRIRLWCMETFLR